MEQEIIFDFTLAIVFTFLSNSLQYRHNRFSFVFS